MSTYWKIVEKLGYLNKCGGDPKVAAANASPEFFKIQSQYEKKVETLFKKAMNLEYPFSASESLLRNFAELMPMTSKRSYDSALKDPVNYIKRRPDLYKKRFYESPLFIFYEK